MGQGRAFSAAVAIWRTGRVERLDVAPCEPGIEAQERRDRAERETCTQLIRSGTLTVSTGPRVPTAQHVIERIGCARETPELLLADRFRLDEVRDAAAGWRVEGRVCRWSEAASDTRELALDGRPCRWRTGATCWRRAWRWRR